MKSELDEVEYIYLFLDEVVSRDGELFIKLNQAAVSSEKEDVEVVEGQFIKNCYPITVEDDSSSYMVHFDDVVLYMAYDECASNWENDKIESKGVIVEFSDSSLLRYVKEQTLVFDITPGDIEHYCVQTANDFIHVLSRGKPTVCKASPNNGG